MTTLRWLDLLIQNLPIVRVCFSNKSNHHGLDYITPKFLNHFVIKNSNVPIFGQTICGVISKQGFSKKSRNLKILFRDSISLFGLKNKRWQWFYLNFWVSLRHRTISRVFHLFVVCFSWIFFRGSIPELQISFTEYLQILLKNASLK